MSVKYYVYVDGKYEPSVIVVKHDLSRITMTGNIQLLMNGLVVTVDMKITEYELGQSQPVEQIDTIAIDTTSQHTFGNQISFFIK